MKTPQTLTESEIQRLIDLLPLYKCSEKRFRRANRNRCMILLMLDAGFRLSEVCLSKCVNLIYDVNVCDSVTVPAGISKNKLERIIPTTNRLKETIFVMLKYVWEEGYKQDIEFAFTSPNRKAHISQRQVQRICGQISEDSFGRRIHPHILRHTFATRLMRKTNIRVVQELLGHKSITSTQIYTHPNGDDLTAAIKGLA